MFDEEQLAAKICDDVAQIFEAVASDTPHEKIYTSDEFVRIKAELKKIRPEMEDGAILSLILKKYSKRLMST